MSDYYFDKNGELKHAGIKGMKWGVRRYQNKDGTLTPAGRKRYGEGHGIAGEPRKLPKWGMNEDRPEPGTIGKILTGQPTTKDERNALLKKGKSKTDLILEKLKGVIITKKGIVGAPQKLPKWGKTEKASTHGKLAEITKRVMDIGIKKDGPPQTPDIADRLIKRKK